MAPWLRPLAVGGIVLVVVLGAVFGALVARPTVTTVVDEVAVECAANTGVSPSECLSWGTNLLSGEPPSATFEMSDLVRIELQRPSFGLSPTCRADYFISRYPDESVWSEEVPCYGDAAQ